MLLGEQQKGHHLRQSSIEMDLAKELQRRKNHEEG